MYPLEVIGDTKLKSNLDVTNKSVVVNFMKDPMLIAELGTKLGIVLKHYKTINAKTLAISKSSRGFSISMAHA